MTQEDMDIRKAAWDSLTDDDREEFEKRKQEIISWSVDEEIKAVEKLKADGKWESGLDGRHPELEEITAEYKRRLSGLLAELVSTYLVGKD